MTHGKEASTRSRVSTRLFLVVGAVGAVAFALGYGTGSLELARLGTPSGVALYAAQFGLGAPARAAVPGAEAAYLPALLPVDASAVEPLPPQF